MVKKPLMMGLMAQQGLWVPPTSLQVASPSTGHCQCAPQSEGSEVSPSPCTAVCKTPGFTLFWQRACPACRTRRLSISGWECSHSPCSPRTLCHQRQRPAWNGTWSPPCTTACCRRSAESTFAQDVVTARTSSLVQIELTGRGSPHAKPPPPKPPWSCPSS